MAKALLGKVIGHPQLVNGMEPLIKRLLTKPYIAKQYAKPVALMHTATELAVVAGDLKNIKISMLKLSYIQILTWQMQAVPLSGHRKTVFKAAKPYIIPLDPG